MYSTAENVLSYVRIVMSTYSTNTVTVVGHSLGALSLLDDVFLNLQLPSVSVSVISYAPGLLILLRLATPQALPQSCN
ncbi:uncharacterized protein BT62DRAFT_933576 [Guyanagaster necrorhizus]|uniref:Uncharacterized protein n=1 Tax=Guyanagaster necrorhizus TaxID=856835 RepID=A0A9P7VQW3_9AGAR|nr:uncharacterized protein BT62DRAFT_933576 [Guyanagaster necrorhizus MCA 3950]KAG7445157.1 hypothetical protein BT62DRAFT_933576 [Guyanagaster necrorhizus MCA 3950]